MADNYNLFLLDGTLSALRSGKYRVKGKTFYIPHSNPLDLYKALVFLPQAIQKPQHKKNDASAANTDRSCVVSCVNTDSLSMAQAMLQEKPSGTKEPLVLNFANPTHPGGGVRKGFNAQEEDLCRKSSLLLSLESAEAVQYYRYHIEQKNNLGSDAIILSPHVDVIRNNRSEFDRPFSVAVISCAAPILSKGTPLPDNYTSLMLHRIKSILTCAAQFGYTELVLGAWGCGAFSNDANDVARLFAEALQEFKYGEQPASRVFHHIGFAVLAAPNSQTEQNNLKSFQEQFHHFRWKEQVENKEEIP